MLKGASSLMFNLAVPEEAAGSCVPAENACASPRQSAEAAPTAACSGCTGNGQGSYRIGPPPRGGTDVSSGSAA
jgi:hypothetical protein